LHSLLGKRFWQYFGIDRDALIAHLNRTYDALRGERRTA
jgi:hypothetical protein